MKTIRILIADDHPVVRRGVGSLLATREGWEVCGEAHTGAEAVEQVKLLKPDIVIMDISMPQMNGLEAVQRIRAFDPQIRVVMLTMHDAEPMFRGAVEAGTQAYVLKSDLDSHLIMAVEALLEGRKFFSPGNSQMIMEKFIPGNGHVRTDPGELSALTPRQVDVLKLLARGKTNKEVANALGISIRTAEAHRYQIMERLQVRSLSELVLYAVRNRIIEV